MKKKKSEFKFTLKTAIRVILFTLLTLLLFHLPSTENYIQGESISLVFFPTSTVTPTQSPPLPVNINNALPPIISAESIVVKDLDSQSTLYSKNEQKLLFPASTTKIMTALVILDKFKLDDEMTVMSVQKDGRIMNLVNGEKLTVESLLYGTLVHSANDAAYTLAENYPGGVDIFVSEMNRKAQSLGLKNTFYTNPVGFDDPRHYTTAQDLVTLSVSALSNKTIDKIVSTKSITVSDTSYTFFHELHNVNQLLGKIAGISGLKTGWTENAGEILISTFRKNGHTILIAILKSSDRFGETEKVIDWVLTNFKWLPQSQITPSLSV